MALDITVNVNLVAATSPAAMTFGQWTLVDSPSAGGDKGTLTLVSAPSDGGSAITAYQYRVNGGAAQAISGTGMGARTVDLPASTLSNVQVRAINAVSANPSNWSDTKTVTPTVSGGAAPTISGTPLLTDGEMTVAGPQPITFYYVSTASATPPSAATIKATPDGSMVLAGGANYLEDMVLETAFGTWYLHCVATNSFGDSAIYTESYVVAAPAIQFVGGKTWTTAGTTSTTNVSLTDLTGGLASAPADGDLVVVAYNIVGNGDPNRDVQVTTGYTEVADLFADSAYEANFGLFYKRMTASPDTQVTFGQTHVGVFGGAGAISVWRGVNAATPLDVSAVTSTGTGSSNPNADPITPTTADAVILVAGGGAQNTSGGSAYTASQLINFLTAHADSALDSTVGLGAFRWVSGEFSPAAWTGGEVAGNNSWAAVAIALRPA